MRNEAGGWATVHWEGEGTATFRSRPRSEREECRAANRDRARIERESSTVKRSTHGRAGNEQGLRA